MYTFAFEMVVRASADQINPSYVLIKAPSLWMAKELFVRVGGDPTHVKQVHDQRELTGEVA